MPNTYPVHLERRFELLYSNYVARLATRVQPKIVREYKKEVTPEIDTLDEELEKLEQRASFIDPGTAGKLVPIQGVMIPEFMRDQLQVIIKDLNEWSFNRMREGAARLGKKRGIKNLAVRIQSESGRLEVQLAKASLNNAKLIGNIKARYFDRIAKATREAVSEGLSTKQLASKLLRVNGATQNKAKFWARDQASKLLGDLNRIRQTDAGFPGYIWQTSRNAKVRPDHAWRHGRYFKWGETDIDPGEDYNCRCGPAPAFGEEDQISPTERRRDIAMMNRDRRRINKLTGSKLPQLSLAALEERAEAA